MRLFTKTSQVIALLSMGLMLMGSDCAGDGAPIQSSGTPGSTSGPADSIGNTGNLSDNEQPEPDANQGEMPLNGGAPAEGTGTLVAGAACTETAQCGPGLACEASFCVKTGEMRIALIWEGRTDLDLHVMTPTGEEIWYRNRISSDGGGFEKDGCIADRCDSQTGPFSEAVLWTGIPNAGTYEFWAINYDGVESTSARFEVRHEGRLETFTVQVGGTANARSDINTYTVEGDETGPGTLKISSHTHEQWVRGPSVTFRVNPGTEAIKRVTYMADNRFDLGSSQTLRDFAVTHRFTNLGERKIKARGFDGSQMELDNDEITVVVMDDRDGLPNPRQGAVVSDRLLAKRILHHSGSIDLYTRQVSGRNDGADSRSNIRAAANGQAAKRSSYGNAPGGSVKLDARMLQAMVILKQVNGYSFRVTSIVGGSHSRNSRHYRGASFDVDIINGQRVGANRTLARRFMQSCRDLGATEVLGPGNRGHSNHVHCAW